MGFLPNERLGACVISHRIIKIGKKMPSPSSQVKKQAKMTTWLPQDPSPVRWHVWDKYPGLQTPSQVFWVGVGGGREGAPTERPSALNRQTDFLQIHI